MRPRELCKELSLKTGAAPLLWLRRLSFSNGVPGPDLSGRAHRGEAWPQRNQDNQIHGRAVVLRWLLRTSPGRPAIRKRRPATFNDG